jgi:hypothetical protein
MFGNDDIEHRAKKILGDPKDIADHHVQRAEHQAATIQQHGKNFEERMGHEAEKLRNHTVKLP